MSNDSAITRLQLKQNPQLAEQILTPDYTKKPENATLFDYVSKIPPFSKRNTKTERSPPQVRLTTKNITEIQNDLPLIDLNTLNPDNNITVTVRNDLPPIDLNTLNPDNNITVTVPTEINENPSDENSEPQLIDLETNILDKNNTDRESKNTDTTTPATPNLTTPTSPDTMTLHTELYIEKLIDKCPTFKGDNKEEFIDCLNYLKDKVKDHEESFVKGIAHWKIKLKDGFEWTKLDKLDDLISDIKAYGNDGKIDRFQNMAELATMKQEPFESVKEFAGKIRIMVKKITNQLEELHLPKDHLKIQVADIRELGSKSFKNGLQSKIRFELSTDTTDFETVLNRAKEIEARNNYINHRSSSNSTQHNTTFNTNNTKKCQFCNQIGHEALFCEANPCAYCADTTHTSFHCAHATKTYTHVCKWCTQIGHSIQSCPSFAKTQDYCQLCQEPNHSAKNCNKKSLYEICNICKDQGHTTTKCLKKAMTLNCILCQEYGHSIDDCEDREEAQIYIAQARLNRKCYSCNEMGHIAQYCPHKFKPRLHQTATYTPQLNRFQNQQINISNTKSCKYCKTSGHSFDECKKFKILQDAATTFCDYCKTSSHDISSCPTIKAMESKANVCSYCKSLGHDAEKCHKLQGNEQTPRL